VLDTGGRPRSAQRRERGTIDHGILKALKRPLRTLSEAWKRGGTLGVAARLVGWSRIPKQLLFVHEVDVLLLGELNARALRPLSPQYRIAIADRSVLEELVACGDTPASVDRRREALSRVFDFGASCITVRDGGRVVAYACAFSGTFHLTYDDYGPLTLPIELGDLAVFLGNSFIRPEYRMKGLFPHLLLACSAMQPAGTRCFGHIDVGNEHSFNSHCRIGFKPLITITCLSVTGARFFYQRRFGATRRSLVARSSRVRLIEQDGVFQLVTGAAERANA